LHFFNEQSGWYSGFGGSVYQTSNGGNTWIQHEVLIEDDLRSIYFIDEANGWVVGSNGIILHYYDSVTDVEKRDHQIPDNFVLMQNYPNPFNPTTTIQYSIPQSVDVSLKIFNILSEEVVNLVNEYQQPSVYKINFDATGLPSGVYFYTLTAGNFVETKKMILIK